MPIVPPPRTIHEENSSIWSIFRKGEDLRRVFTRQEQQQRGSQSSFVLPLDYDHISILIASPQTDCPALDAVRASAAAKPDNVSVRSALFIPAINMMVFPRGNGRLLFALSGHNDYKY